MNPQLERPAPASVRPPTASVASWLSVLFVLLLATICVGGYVRLSESGLSIATWPFVNGSFLPPVSEQGWLELKVAFVADQERLHAEAMRGAAGIGSLGRVPEDMGVFQRMVVIEWTHRLVATIVGLVAAACLSVTLRHAETRRRAGALLILTSTLIIAQAIVGGLLVRSGTATHWLFVHLGTAALILGLIVWTILRLVAPIEIVPETTVRARRSLRFVAWTAVAVTWIQIMLGALVAGSRGSDRDVLAGNDFSSEWPLMAGRLVPDLWVEQRPLAWNLLDNALLHQWVHRWSAMLVLIAIIALIVVALRTPTGPRLRLGLRVVATFLFAQVILGLANVTLTHPTMVSLSHLVMGMFLLAGLILVAHDARFESAELAPLPQGTPA